MTVTEMALAFKKQKESKKRGQGKVAGVMRFRDIMDVEEEVVRPHTASLPRSLPCSPPVPDPRPLWVWHAGTNATPAVCLQVFWDEWIEEMRAAAVIQRKFRSRRARKLMQAMFERNTGTLWAEVKKQMALWATWHGACFGFTMRKVDPWKVQQGDG